MAWAQDHHRQHARQHRRALRMGQPRQRTVSAQSNEREDGAHGASMPIDISIPCRQPWPRTRIQATIGTVIAIAIPTWCANEGSVMTPGMAMKRTMPIVIARHISTKWNAKRAMDPGRQNL
jgi:hypothetical protein